MVEKRRVVVAMSGGVDSSVAASLLVDQGYDVTGVMLKLWADVCGEKDNACCPPEAIAQAREVASILGIPFYVLDVREVFKQKIVDQFVQDYAIGLTPNPCFNCNRWIRWGYLLNFGLNNGFEWMATGHYARVVQDNEGKTHLLKGIDENKDQSYVLSGLDQSQLGHTILPLGELRKPEVRSIASQKGLPVAEKHDSQDLCFIGAGGYREFIQRQAPESVIPGEMVTRDGEVIGYHDGLANYTIGQRKGLGAGNAEPIYVIQKEIETNRLIVGSREHLGIKTFRVLSPHSLQEEQIDQVECAVRVRYKASEQKCTVKSLENGDWQVELEVPLRGVTPGQIAVFYDGDQVIASGIISQRGRET